jgi:hypothetical protein
MNVAAPKKTRKGPLSPAAMATLERTLEDIKRNGRVAARAGLEVAGLGEVIAELEAEISEARQDPLATTGPEGDR